MSNLDIEMSSCSSCGCGSSCGGKGYGGEKLSQRRAFASLTAVSLAFALALVIQKQLKATPYGLAEYAVFVSIYLVSGWNVLRKAARNIARGRVFDENFLMTISTLGAFAVRAPAEAVAVMLFYRIGNFLEDLAVDRSRRSVRALLEVRPDYANLVEEGGVIRRVAPEEVAEGDLVRVKPGEKIPLDGVVKSGATQMDTSMLTGEPVPRDAGVGEEVMAGMINLTGLITVEVTKPLGESSIARILDLVENGTRKKAKTELFFTTFARYYTPSVVLITLLTAIIPPLIGDGQTFSEWIYRALVILVVSCPCALVVSIPLTYFGGIGAASKNGILIKGSDFLDALNSVETIFFDKTGTITKGVFKVTGTVTKNGFSTDDLLELAALAESHSNHPIALSILQAYGKPVDAGGVTAYKETAGGGIIAEVHGKSVLAGNDKMLHLHNIDHDTCNVEGTVVHVAVDDRYVGYLIISDEMKEDSALAMVELKAEGVGNLVMLTGDGDFSARVMSEKAGVGHYHANLLPEDKVELVEREMERPGRRGKTVFVGDGINDAPVIARADIGMSMCDLGSDAAIETADIVLMDGSLRKIPQAIRIAKRNRAVLIQNVVFALGVKTVLIVLGFFGVANMWEAVFGDVGVTLMAILNASRMLRSK